MVSIDSTVSKVNGDKTGITEKSADQWREEKAAELNELHEMLEKQTLATFSSPEALASQLRAQARLRNLSASNALLVEAQLPGAQEVRTFDEWKEKVRSVSILKDEKALLHSANTAVTLSDKLPEYFSARFDSGRNVIEVRPDLSKNMAASLARPVAAAYRHRQGKSSDSHLITMTAAILAFRIDPAVQVPRENLAVCVDQLTPNEPKDLRALLTEAAKDAKELHSSYLIHHRELTAKKKTRDIER